MDRESYEDPCRSTSGRMPHDHSRLRIGASFSFVLLRLRSSPFARGPTIFVHPPGHLYPRFLSEGFFWIMYYSVPSPVLAHTQRRNLVSSTLAITEVATTADRGLEIQISASLTTHQTSSRSLTCHAPPTSSIDASCFASPRNPRPDIHQY